MWIVLLVLRFVEKKNQIVICLPTKHLGVLKNVFKCIGAFQIELECGSIGFLRRWENRSARIKPLGARERTNNKINPHMASALGFEPGPLWWKASALTMSTLAPPCLTVWGNGNTHFSTG